MVDVINFALYTDTMQPTLSDVRARLDEIEKAKRALDAEAAELQTAIRVLERLAASLPTHSSHMMPLTAAGSVSAVAVGQLLSARISQKSGALRAVDMIVGALRTAPSPWLTTPEIHSAIQAAHNVDMSMGTLRPTLSNLKNDGIVVRDGERVALVERIKKKEAPAKAEAPINPSVTADQNGTALPAQKGGILD